MRKLFVLTMMLSVLLSAVPASADPGTLHVDDDDPTCGGNSPCYSTIQAAISAASAGDTIHVAAGTYAERVIINKSLDLFGAQHGVDPTAAGARTNPANESIVDVTALGYANPDIAVEIASGVSGVTIDGFTLIGDPTNSLADTSVIRCWASSVAISNNIIDGKYGVLYKGGDALTVHRNRMVVNNVGVTVQPNPASNVTVSDNVINLGSNPAGDASATYMTSCSGCSVTGNAATGFVNGRGTGGSNLSHLTVSGNTFTGNKDGISIWGNSTYITIADNDLSNSLRYGINIKGQDIDITGNEINGCGDSGINVARHVIDTERVTILCNNISANASYGVEAANVAEIINAEHNWWGNASGPYHPTANGGGTGDAVSDDVDFDPWLSAPVGDVCPPPPVIEVDIDIKPGSFPNSINLKSQGVVPVAVLTTDDFDATTVDPDTVSFAGASPLRWAREDVDGDGDIDLLFRFRTQELSLDENSTEATLTGTTYGGASIQGTDTVSIVPKGT